MKLNSPRTLEVCRTNGVLPEELYYIEYKDYLSAHPEISNLPEDIKKYRFNLLEKLRQKTIKMIKAKRKELIEQQENPNYTEIYEKKEKLTQYNNNTPEHESQAANITFSEKMNSMIKKERANIKKIKQKQKQNIEFMIEQQMKAELINYRNIEKDKKVKENKEKKMKEIHEKSIKNQRIQEEMKQKRLTNVEEIDEYNYMIRLELILDNPKEIKNINTEKENKEPIEQMSDIKNVFIIKNAKSMNNEISKEIKFFYQGNKKEEDIITPYKIESNDFDQEKEIKLKKKLEEIKNKKKKNNLYQKQFQKKKKKNPKLKFLNSKWNVK